jgi:hypothetical protein
MTLRLEGSEHYGAEETFDALEAFEREAGDRGVSMAALARVVAPCPGDHRRGRRSEPLEHLAPVREALDIELTGDERDALGRMFR